MDLSYVKFSEINLSDTFFDSLKVDYAEFEQWFKKKAADRAYVLKKDDGSIDGFLYVKIETGSIDDVTPPLPPCERIKIGTLKINPHGTRLGERFIKKAFDHAIMRGVPEIYVTVFEKHEALVSLFMRYGFRKAATKTTHNGTELVLLKKMNDLGISSVDRYPLVKTGGQSIYLLSLYPKWHTRLLPDSILKNEDASIVQDVSHTNSIHKVYLAAMKGMENLQPGDVLLIYRTSDNEGPAHYRSVATSICVVEEYRNINSFSSRDEFIRYCAPYSVFSESELNEFWTRKKYPHVIRFTYNLALPKRVTRGKMIEDMGFNADDYWGFMKLSAPQFQAVIKAGGLNESLIVN
ncbi:MAG TPA: N-acetyltransferase [Kiritimatiellia bacterium]|nr:N-acetyltransferase [Kiritimatiellia bacterium]HMP00562.1 N-acetyltransferase [Kiritimatiellia bacterium]